MLPEKKLTFSLVCLVVLLALGFAVAPVMAHPRYVDDDPTKAERDHRASEKHLEVDFGLDTSVIDVSSYDSGNMLLNQEVQIDAGRVRAYATHPRPFVPRGLAAAPEPILTFLVEFSDMVPLDAVQTFDGDDPLTPDTVETTYTRSTNRNNGNGFGLNDISISAYDEFDRLSGSVTLLDTTEVETDTDDPDVATIAFTNPGGTREIVPGERVGRQFTISVYLQALENLDTLLKKERGGDFEIATLLFSFGRDSVDEAITLEYQLALGDPANYKAYDADNLKLSGLDKTGRIIAEGVNLKDEFERLKNGPEKIHLIRIDLVDVDEGDPKYLQLDGDGDGEIIPVAAVVEADPYPDTAIDVNPSGYPNVVSITRLRGTSDDITTPLGYGIPANSPSNADLFRVKVVLTEQPEASFLEGNGVNLIAVENGVVVGIDAGLPFGNAAEGVAGAEKDAVLPPISEGGYAEDQDATGDGADPIPEPTGRDNRYWQYRVTIDPDRATADDVIVTVNEFDDRVLPEPKTYKPLTARQRKLTDTANPFLENRLKNGREILSIPAVASEGDSTLSTADATIQTDYDAAKKLRTETDKRGHEIFLGGGTVIPANGYLVLRRGDQAQSGVRDSSADKNDDKGVAVPTLTAAQRLYTTAALDFPAPADDLENFFRNGATIQLVHKNFPEHTALVVAQGRQAIAVSSKVETAAEETVIKDEKVLANKKTGYTGVSDATALAGSIVISEIMWVNGATSGTKNQWIELHNTTDADIMIDAEEWVLAFGDSSSALSDGVVVDTVGNQPAGVYWPVEVGGGGNTIVATGEVTDVVSMYRGITAAGEVMDGEAQASWIASAAPSTNVLLGVVGSPGVASPAVAGPATPITPIAPITPAAAVATADDIRVSEIMVASDGGRFPQWIELANVSGSDVSLMGWSVVVENADDDEVIGSSLSIDIGDVTVGDDQVALIISKETERNSGVGTGKGDLRADRIVDAQSQLSPESGRYTFLSEMGFMISLMPPQTTGVVEYGDIVGNLGEGWDLPMAEEDRSSIIRREMGTTAEIMGTDAAGWVLASDTMLDGAYRNTYYGHDDDAGTPGFNAGGALPVELSKFGAKRDPLTGAVMITWATQSELNNAGFYIKRSQQKDGKFVVVNPTMIAGAGTTAEKQSYTYTDATADPNVIYYYQIEDVSLDGNRQTLTRAHRLKGHVGAAGKATTTWGDLKSSRD